MTKQRMTGRFRGNALLVLWVCGVILVPSVIVPTAVASVPRGVARVSTATVHGSTATARAAAATFTLTATQANFAEYYPTYLANGYWSVASSLLGTAPTVAHMVGIMDYDADDVSRPAAIPSWNEIDYFDGGAWLNGSTVGAQTHTGYGQTLDMHDGVLRTRYQWIDGERATDVSVTSFVSESSAHLGVVSLELTPHFSGRIRLRFTLQSPPLPKRLPLARMSAVEFSAAAVAAHQEDLVSGGHRDAIWYPGHVEVKDSGGDTDTDTLFMAGAAVRGRTVALAAAIGLPADLPRIHKTVQTAADATALEIEVQVHGCAASIHCSGSTSRRGMSCGAATSWWAAAVICSERFTRISFIFSKTPPPIRHGRSGPADSAATISVMCFGTTISGCFRHCCCCIRSGRDP